MGFETTCKRWWVESKAGHVVICFAEDMAHALERWQEFHQTVKAYKCWEIK